MCTSPTQRRARIVQSVGKLKRFKRSALREYG
jgi:hypothetical protein